MGAEGLPPPVENPHDRYANLSLMGGQAGHGLEASAVDPISQNITAEQPQPGIPEAAVQPIGINVEAAEPGKWQRFKEAAKTAGQMLLGNAIQYGKGQLHEASTNEDHSMPSGKEAAGSVWDGAIGQAEAERVVSGEQKHHDAERLLKIGKVVATVGGIALKYYVSRKLRGK